MARGAWGNGVAAVNRLGATLDVFFADVGLGNRTDPSSVERSANVQREIDWSANALAALRSVTIANLDDGPGDVDDAYLRLHLLSHRLVRPNEINLDGIFAVLPNVCWTSAGPVDPEEVGDLQLRARLEGHHFEVRSVDKFPRMLDYVVPSGVRIANADRVRLGAYLAEGTTVMHEGFVNFNAGTLGPCMVEGRISQGVTVGAHTDIGGGASIMGTLSGGGTQRVSVGERCLLGANSGLGIPLGDDCVLEAGLYLTAGTVVTTEDGDHRKAHELAGVSGVLFRRNSLTGAVEARSRIGRDSALNTELHLNQ